MGSYLKYAFRDAFRSLNRHKGMVFASMLTITITLSVLGGTVLLAFNSQHAVKDMEQELEIMVFVYNETTREQALALQDQIEQVPGFKEATFVPKEEALVDMDSRLGEETELFEAMGDTNPLPDAYRVKAETTEAIPGIVSAVSQLPEVELVRYGQDLVDNMVALTSGIQIISVVLIVGMMMAALFLVNSTIRLTVFARSEEITIMRYVGATNTYIRAPFFLEGLLIGVIGAIVASIAVYFGYQEIVEYVGMKMSFIPLMTNNQSILFICVSLILGGALLGALGSMIAVRKYLKV